MAFVPSSRNEDTSMKKGLMSMRRRAFTLIELLVVIAIIAVLICALASRRAISTGSCPASPVHE